MAKQKKKLPPKQYQVPGYLWAAAELEAIKKSIPGKVLTASKVIRQILDKHFKVKP